MKIRHVLDFDTVPVSLRNAWRHQPRLQTHVAVAHLAVKFGLGYQRRHRIHHEHVNNGV